MLYDLILGTAGHIDHGKTSLIAALTGINTDRLPEEKKRGITIEPGYAYLDLSPYHLGIVDVPGHEKFIRQMLAGATGIDLVLLVVAANDSVKQQTREHLDILRILDLPAGVITITKADLVEDDWLELVKEEVRELVRGTFLAEAPIVPTSAKTGAGLDELKSALRLAADRASTSQRRLRIQAPFKMAIDRAFTIEGHGTVVTGSVSSGTARVGETIEIQPGGKPARIRSLECHDQASEQVHRGQRAAINLTGVSLEDVTRGHELSAVGHLAESRLMTVELFQLQSTEKPLKDRRRVRFHIGTAELLGTIKLLDRDELAPGSSCFAQIYLNEPSAAIWNQPFVVRRESPVYTIGGGRVLDSNAEKIRNPSHLDLQMLADLAGVDEFKRANAVAWFHAQSGWAPADLPRLAGVLDVDRTVEQLKTSGSLIEMKLSATRTLLIQCNRFDQICQRVLSALEKLHERFPLRFRHPRSELEGLFAYLPSRDLLHSVLKRLQSEKKIDLNESTIGLAGAGPKLSKNERHLIDQLVQDVKKGGVRPPTSRELVKAATKNKDSVAELLRLAAENGDLIAIADDLYFHREVFEDVCQQLATEISQRGGLTMSEIRQILDTSRKFAIPLCEYLDSIGFTQRDGDNRVLGSAETVSTDVQ